MAITVMILGESGTGKSASLRKFDKDELAVVNVIGKPLPFRQKHFETLNSDNYTSIRNFVNATNKKSIVIDDAQYLMANEFMRRANERGYDKFTDIGQNFWNLINYCAQKLPDDVIVYFLQHTETTQDGSGIKAKTIGKMLDEKITLEGMFSIVLRTSVDEGVYSFSTQNNGADTVKSPVGMFNDTLIPNDLKMVDNAIREYYDLGAEPQPKQEDPEEMPGGKYIDLNAPDNGIVDDDNPLMGRSDYGRIKALMIAKGVSDKELRALVADKDVYPFTTLISEYDPDFIDYLIDNFNKIYTAIVAKRDPLG